MSKTYTNNQIVRIWEDKNKKKHKIHVLPNKYVCVSDMAKATKRRINKYLDTQETQEYLIEVSYDVGLPVSNKNTDAPFRAFEEQGNMPSIIVFNYQGSNKTYVHPLVATHFAYWANTAFALWVNKIIIELTEGKNSKTLPFAPERHTYIYRPLEEGRSAWDLMFEKPLYDQLYGLDNRVNEEPYNQHPPYFAQYTVKYIYDELMDVAPKRVYEELRLLRANDRPKGLRMLHQYLSDEGKILLCKTIGAITELVRQANNVSPYPHIKKNYLALKLAERKGQLTLPIYDEFALKGSKKIIGNYDEFHQQLIEKVTPITTKSFLRQSVKILEMNYQNIIFGVKSDFLKSIGHRQKSEIELAIEAILNKNLSVMFKTYEEYLFGEVSERDQKTNIQDYQQPF